MVRWRTASDEAYPRHCHSEQHLDADETAVFRTAENLFVEVQCAVQAKRGVVADRPCSMCGEG